MHLFRGSRPPGQGGHDWDPRDGVGRSRRGEGRRHDGEHHRHGNNHPWQCERADHVVGTRLDTRSVGQPDHQAQCRSDKGADDTRHDAVGPHDKTDVLVGGAQGPDHPDRAKPSLRQHREAPHRNKADEKHPEGVQREHDGLGVE